MRVLLDTNVIVDVLQDRAPWSSDGRKIFYAVANNQISGFITAKEATDIYYITRKQLAGQKNVEAKARDILSTLFALFGIVDTLAADCLNAILFENKDYEDAIMIGSAERAGMDCIVTRNKEHFKGAPLPVYTPKEFVAKLSEDTIGE